MECDLGLIGLAVMGQNLVLNMNEHGFKIAVYNRTAARTEEFINGEARGTQIVATYSVEDLVKQLKRPRRVMLMVKAGKPVDDFIETLLKLLEPGDIIIDGGNSNYEDTIRRTAHVESKGLYYVGMGVSGGEDGARNGPSIMPGGSKEAWPYIKDIFQSIAAKVEDGTPCCDWVGPNGAGHFVKMVHNGIEYCDMQLISEAYNLMKTGLGLSADDMADVFDRWNRGELDSYLIEITASILKHMDKDGAPLVDKILDSAGQKGTGRWTVETALEMGVPLTGISEAVMARSLSAFKQERVEASRLLSGPDSRLDTARQSFLTDLEPTVYVAKILSYTQGFMLMRSASQEYQWDLNYGRIALLWRAGCIIRSAFLDKINEAYERKRDLANLLLDPYFKDVVEGAQAAWRRVVAQAVMAGITVPAMSSTLSFFDGYRSAWLPANLIQAQRDFFGAHTYERVDAPAGEFFHTNWSGTGGKVTAGSYKA